MSLLQTRSLLAALRTAGVGGPFGRAVHAADSIERFFVYAPTSEQPVGALFLNAPLSATTIDG